MKRIRYQSHDGIVVTLEVPWGDHSGHIPPPFIEFTGAAVVFTYQGDDLPAGAV